MSTYVSIGRNIGAEPMSAMQWEDFISRVVMAVTTYAGPVISVARGVGAYGGMQEHTAVVVGAASPLPWQKEVLRVLMAELARMFGQECIAMAVAEPEFIDAAT